MGFPRAFAVSGLPEFWAWTWGAGCTPLVWIGVPGLGDMGGFQQGLRP